jgi:hypothetical protein
MEHVFVGIADDLLQHSDAAEGAGRLVHILTKHNEDIPPPRFIRHFCCATRSPIDRLYFKLSGATSYRPDTPSVTFVDFSAS